MVGSDTGEILKNNPGATIASGKPIGEPEPQPGYSGPDGLSVVNIYTGKRVNWYSPYITADQVRARPRPSSSREAFKAAKFAAGLTDPPPTYRRRSTTARARSCTPLFSTATPPASKPWRSIVSAAAGWRHGRRRNPRAEAVLPCPADSH